MSAPPTLAGLFRAAAPNAELLARFVATRDEPAFAALVQRHGPTVWRVCRKLVRQPADAEDAYQATFLLLVRHAAKVRNPAAVGAWLYGAAVKVATRVRTRRKPEPLLTEPAALADLTVAEAEGVFHEELARLPAKFRDPLVLCCLDALTRDEAATRLGIGIAAVKHRLERGRELLRANLLRRGVAVGVPLLAGWLAPATLAAVPTFHLHAVMPAVSTLVHEVGAILFPSTWKSAVAVGLLAVAVGWFGLTLALGGGQPGDPPPVKAKPPAEVKPMAKEFDELSAVLKPSGLGNGLPATVTITPDGKCVYETAGRPGINTIPAWPGKKVTHTLPPDRLKRLKELLKGTDWLGKAASKDMPQMHSTDYTLTLKRDGKPSTADCCGEQEPYLGLTTFLAELSRQEFLLYQLESVPDRDYSANARHTLDSYLRAELGEPFASKPTFALDYTRFAAWATGLVRKPEGKSADDLRTAVRLVAHLRLESERKTLTELTRHENSNVRRAAGDALDWMSPEAVKLAQTLAEYRVKMPPAEGFQEQEGRGLTGSDFTQSHLTGVAKRLKATTRGEALVLFAHLHVEPSVDVRFIAAVALDGIYKYQRGFAVTAFTDVKSLEHRQMLVDFQVALDASGK